MTIKELKKNPLYSFNCYYSKRQAIKETKNCEVCDIWSFAELLIGNKGVEYNFCIDDSTNEAINSSAIYPTYLNEKEDYWETEYNNFIHYEIDFNDKNWKKKLENAMCEAFIKFPDYDDEDDWDDENDETLYRCTECDLFFTADEITGIDNDGNDLCPACAKPITEDDIWRK